MSKPVVFLTFANQQDDHLPLLKQESSLVKEALLPLEQRSFIKLEREESTETADLIKILSAYPDQLCIFHYGGHAGHQMLELEDQTANAKGLAQLLGEQEELQLVFLNGCSTQGQVEALLQAGVKAVIATSVPIEDQRAVLFANAFYRALANKRTLKRAFQFAQSALSTQSFDLPGFEIVRGAGKKPQKAPKKLPWRLYLAEKTAEETLNWRLPYYRKEGLPGHIISDIGQRFKLNKYIAFVLDEMFKYNEDIYSQMIIIKEGQEVHRDPSTYIDLVIQNFPWVIASQIQLLRQHYEANQARLEQLLSTYILTSQTLFYILLSNFWDEKRRLNFPLPKGFTDQIKQTPKNIRNFDFLKKLLILFELMESQEAQYAVPELEVFCKQLRSDENLQKAWKDLENFRKQVLNSTLEGDIAYHCENTEIAVSTILLHAAFLAGYRMLTVRDIKIENPRYSKVVYDLDMGALNAIVNTSLSIYDAPANRRKESYSNCDSIVLSASENDFRQSLTLSPFIIDKNTYLGHDHIHLFMYAYEDQDKYYYLFADHNFFKALDNQMGTDIIDTSMTKEDFAEGRNINKNLQAKAPGGNAFSRFAAVVQTQTKDENKAFELLERQFEEFKSDLS